MEPSLDCMMLSLLSDSPVQAITKLELWTARAGAFVLLSFSVVLLKKAFPLLEVIMVRLVFPFPFTPSRIVSFLGGKRWPGIAALAERRRRRIQKVYGGDVPCGKREAAELRERRRRDDCWRHHQGWR